MAFKSTIVVLVTSLGAVCTGCNGPIQAIPTDFEYVSTSLGLRNSGLLQPGQLYFLDVTNGTLVDLQESVDLIAPTRPDYAQSRTATNVRGVAFGTSVSTTPVDASLEAEFERRVSFEVKDAERVNHSKIWTSLGNAYARDRDANYVQWRVERLTSDPGRYKLVLLVDPTIARSEEILVSSGLDVGVGGIVKTVKIGDTKFKYDDSKSAKCTGVGESRATCFLTPAVLEGYLVEKDGVQKLHFRTSDPISPEVLPNAFRNLS